MAEMVKTVSVGVGIAVALSIGLAVAVSQSSLTDEDTDTGLDSAASTSSAPTLDDSPCDTTPLQLAGRETGQDVGLLGDDCSTRTLVATPADEYDPAVSPDGSSLVFVRSSNEDASEIVQIDLRGASDDETVLIRSDGLVGEPRWSPDGQQIVYWANDDQDAVDIWAFNTATEEAVQLTNARTVSVHPEWAPDGNSVYFSTGVPGGTQLASVPGDGGEVRMITQPGDLYKQPVSSPDGSQLAAVADVRGGFESAVVLIDPQSGEARDTSPSFDLVIGLEWTEDGLSVLTQQDPQHVTRIYLDENLDVTSRESLPGRPGQAAR